jgi:arsenate reductase
MPGAAMLTFYHYARCNTCVRAKKYLAAKGYALKEIDITTSPPPEVELKRFISKSGRRYTDFLNRSGTQYREKNMKEKVKRLSEPEVIKMLSSEGRLIKRPIVTDGTKVTVGFDEAEFKKDWPGKRNPALKNSGDRAC